MILFFFPQRIERTLTFLQYKSLENTVGEGEIARKRAISPFPTVFPTLLENFQPLSSGLKLSSAHTNSLEILNLSFGKWLNSQNGSLDLQKLITKQPGEQSKIRPQICAV